ncbi:MAG: hypothetical protein ABTQ25_11600, partial [Nitrosomonas ureae]
TVRPAALAEPDLVRYTIRLPVWVIRHRLDRVDAGFGSAASSRATPNRSVVSCGKPHARFDDGVQAKTGPLLYPNSLLLMTNFGQRYVRKTNLLKSFDRYTYCGYHHQTRWFIWPQAAL